MKIAFAILMLLASLAAAHAFGLGKEGKNFGRLGAISNKSGPSGPALQGALMLEDGTSFLLLEDGASHLCFEGGC